MSSPTPEAVFACPRCDRSPLQSQAGGYRCAGCKVDFPLIDGIPWLFAEPSAALGDWRGRLAFLLGKLEQDAGQLEAAAKSTTISGLTRQRLRAHAEAIRQHREALKTLLAPLELAPARASFETYLALRTRLPPDQGLTTYYNNIHRDWCWGGDENAASLAIVSERLGGTDPGRTLILGAGAGRLAYDIHAQCKPTATVALDFNPLLLLLAKRISAGETLELYEFPLAPKSLEQQAVLRRLSAEAPAAAGLHYVLADAHRPPFANGSFDTVVTPWLIDILPEAFEIFCARANALLDTGGRWINFGSLNFHNADPALRYSLEECAEIVAGAGFEPPRLDEREIPYMCSPASRHGRREQVLSWAARKQANTRRPPRYEALPDWLVRGKEPVPLLEAFKIQAMSTRIHAFIVSLIDGRRSLADMAALCVEQQLLARDEAEPALRSLLIKLYEDSRRGRTY